MRWSGCVALCLVLSSLARAQPSDPHPPIPIRFHLTEPGYVTLVIEDAAGMRVRNLVSETPFPAGESAVYWDALDDLARDTDAAKHAVYHVPGKLVAAGEYRVRGLVRPQIDLRYEMTAYNPGNPPWMTKDRSSGWLANHTPPSTVLFVPEGGAPERPGHPATGGQILVGSFVSEGGSGLAWLNLDGQKVHGQEWVGGVWTGATQLCRDEGEHAIPGVYAYTGSAWRGDKYNGNQPELRLHMLVNGAGKLKTPGDARMGTGEDPPVLSPTFKLPADLGDPEHASVPALGGLAARDGILVAAVTPLDRLVLIDVAARKTLATMAMKEPRGLAFENAGGLLAISGKQVVRVAVPKLDRSAATTQAVALPEAPKVIVGDGLDEPQALALDAAGNVYVSDRGDSHQVKVFGPDGRALRAIGTRGRPRLGTYDPSHMHNPAGITIDGRGRLWVAENDFLPKRLSVWTPEGKLAGAYYGPPHYGGGGSIDPVDRSRFFYADSGGAVELRLDWAHGTSDVAAVYLRPELDPLRDCFRTDRTAGPETPLHVGDRVYLTDAYNTNPTGGTQVASVYLLRDGIARPVAVIGQCNNNRAFDVNAPPPKKGMPRTQAAPPLAGRLPPKANLKGDRWMFAWSDRNDDGQVQPEEVTCAKGDVLSVNVRRDLSAVTGTGLRISPSSFTPGGAPVFDLKDDALIVADAQRPASSGGGQALVDNDGRFVLTTAPKPFSPFGFGGGAATRATWSYPSLWPGLHASHNAAMPEFPGELIGTTRLLGLPVDTPVGEVFAVNGNKGNVYLFTTDGLFVATLFKDSRTASWNPPSSRPGTLVNDQSIKEEDFFPSISQTKDGAVYLSVLNCCLVRVDGLDKARRIAPKPLIVTAKDLAAARAYFTERETARQARAQGEATKTPSVSLRVTPPAVDGKLDDWPAAQWVTIDERVAQIGDWGHRKVATRAALCATKDRLYAAFQTDATQMLNNRGDSLQNLFKTGACLDLMIGADAAADPNRDRPAEGDQRLLVTRVKGKTVAMLYRQVDAHPTGQPAEYTSPVKSVKFASVRDVSDQVELVEGETKDDGGKVTLGAYELSVPLEVLNLRPAPGQVIRGDLGVLRGNGYETLQRAYWSNKASGLVSDLPSEAELTPRLWGAWRFE